MKQKYHSLLALGLVAISVSTSIVYATFAPWADNTLKMDGIVHLPDISVPGPAVVGEFMRLERVLEDINNLSKSDSTPVDLSLFGYKGSLFSDVHVTEQVNLNPPLSELVPVSFDHTLSLIFVSSDSRFCIIDGSFYKEGSVLPDNGTIEKIETKKVLIKKQGIGNWIYLTTAFLTDKNEVKQK